MTTALDIYRSAKPLINQHGEDASSFAAMQAGKRASSSAPRGKTGTPAAELKARGVEEPLAMPAQPHP